MGAQTSDTESGFFLNAQEYSVSHIDGEGTRGDILEKGIRIGHGGGRFSTLVDPSDFHKDPVSDA